MSCWIPVRDSTGRPSAVAMLELLLASWANVQAWEHDGFWSWTNEQTTLFSKSRSGQIFNNQSIINITNSQSSNWKWKCVNFKCYSSEELITLNTLHEVVPTRYSFHIWVDWSNADKVSCSRRKHIDARDWTVNLCIQNRHSNHYTNCSQIFVIYNIRKYKNNQLVYLTLSIIS